MEIPCEPPFLVKGAWPISHLTLNKTHSLFVVDLVKDSLFTAINASIESTTGLTRSINLFIRGALVPTNRF